MPRNIKIKAGQVEIAAELNDSITAQAIINALPIKAVAQRWGGEVYFSIPVSAELESPSRDVLEAGQLAYWPTGRALCLFFGPTPASKADEIRAASAVNIVEKMTGDWSGVWDVSDGAGIIVESA